MLPPSMRIESFDPVNNDCFSRPALSKAEIEERRSKLVQTVQQLTLPTQEEIDAGPHSGLGTEPSDYLPKNLTLITQAKDYTFSSSSHPATAFNLFHPFIDEMATFVKMAEANGLPGMVAGGCLRDTILGKKIKDVDFFTTAYKGTIERFIKKLGGTVKEAVALNYTKPCANVKSTYSLQVYDCDMPMLAYPLQIICFKPEFEEDVCYQHVNTDFDINLCKVYVDNKGLMLTHEFMQDVKNKTITCKKDHLQKDHAKRVASKYPEFKLITK